jgi:thioesterase domain-containing protein
VHPSGGNVFCFLQLSHQLGQDQPFYAFQSKGLNAGERPHTQVEEMAAYYIQALRKVRPGGPYLLGGWSMGGLVAFEMAQQLRGEGEDIRLVALLDTKASYDRKPGEDAQREHLINFAHEVASSWGLETKWDELQLEWDDLSRFKPAEQLDRILARAKDLGVIPADAGLVDGQRLLEVFSANAEAMHRYVPQTYDGRLTVIRTNDHRGAMAEDPTLGWGRLATGGVDSYVVGGTHYTMIRNPFLREVSTALAASLKLAHQGD